MSKLPERKREDSKQITPVIEPKSLTTLAGKTGNLYKSINIISKRANQLNVQLKEELQKKLEEFNVHTDNLEEVFENREQIEISRAYERLPKTTLQALNEFLHDEIYFKDSNELPEVEK